MLERGHPRDRHRAFAEVTSDPTHVDPCGLVPQGDDTCQLKEITNANYY